MSLLKLWRINLPPGVWTPITVPVVGRNLVIANVSNQQIRMRSDPDNPVTEDVLAVTAQQGINTSPDGLWDRVSVSQVLIHMQPTQDEFATVVVRCTP